MNELLIAIVIIALLCMDRFILKRHKVRITHARHVDDPKSIRFALGFFTSKSITKGKITYTMRRNKKPNAVLAFERPIIFSRQGENSEWLTFSLASLEREAGEPVTGSWTLDVKIERSCSYWNPMYKIFPQVATHTEEIDFT